PGPAARLVAVALTLDSALRLLRSEHDKSSNTRKESLLFVAYFGGMSGGLVLGLGWLFGLGRRMLVGSAAAEADVLGVVLAMGMAFLVAHYLIQGIRFVLVGLDARAFLRNMAVPGILAEASLLPLAIVVVLLFEPDRPLGLVLLSTIYLLINLVFNQLSSTSISLRKRVAELETLNRTAHTLGSALDRSDLVESIAKETLSAIPEAEVLALSYQEEDYFVVDYYDKERGEYQRARAPAQEGASALVVKSRETLYVSDMRRSDCGTGGDSGIRSWLGVPVNIDGDVIGVLSVQSREQDAFDRDQKRLLEAIGAQAAVAIQNAKLYELATVDGLTGLYVRRHFDARLKEEIERSRRFKSTFSLILFDIDDFKKLNDNYGHQIGDRVLRDIAKTVRSCMRGVDIPARYGGEEFAFILPRTRIVDAHAVAERVRQDVADARIANDGKLLKVTASLGVACHIGGSQGDASTLMRQADVAMYRAKALGKNRVELYWPDEEPGQETEAIELS
ncbi:MAG: sensor domain-containing diguanylate cyclase, partial [Pseudomonadota bacterium]